MENQALIEIKEIIDNWNAMIEIFKKLPITSQSQQTIKSIEICVSDLNDWIDRHSK